MAERLVDATELPSLRREGERLKLEHDNAQLRADLAQLGKPWWRKGSVITTLTAIVAAVVPVTTGVQAHYQKEREIALQESKQAHEIRTSYLDRLAKPGAKLRTLRFVLATSSDPALQAWAEAEKKEVQAELNDIKKQLDESEQQIKALSDLAQPPDNGIEKQVDEIDQQIKALSDPAQPPATSTANGRSTSTPTDPKGAERAKADEKLRLLRQKKKLLVQLMYDRQD